MRQPIDLNTISDETLLHTRIRDLPISIRGTWLEECIAKLYEELKEKEIRFSPQCYLADEWLTPDQEPVVGIPFFLAHPALMRLEKQMMLDVEGGTKPWCLKLLRHETGHALNYAYRLFIRKHWQKLFGRFHQDYPDTYRFRPYSRSFVRHLEDYYAQYHPDEDFAETFAVWLDPESDWHNQYKGWKAMDKLNYVDTLMKSLRNKEPLVPRGRKYWQSSRITATLERYYKKKRHSYAEDFHDFHDVNLKRIFSDAPEECAGVMAAYAVLRKYRKNIINTVSSMTGEKKYILDDLLAALINRCRDLRLVIPDSEPLAMVKITAYVTTLMMNYMYTGRLRGRHEKKA